MEATTLHDSNNFLVGFGRQIDIMGWEVAPILKLAGVSSANLKKLGPNFRDWPSRHIKWPNYPLHAQTSEIDGTPGTGTSISVHTNQGKLWRKGDVFYVPSTGEKILVQSVTGDALTVERGWGSTSAAAPTNDAQIVKITRVMPEGFPTFETGYVGVIGLEENYTQIISQAVMVTGSEKAQSNLAIRDQMDFQIARLISDGDMAGELPKALANIFYYGERIARTTTGSTIASSMGSAGGFDTFVTSGDLVTSNLGRSLQRGDITSKLRKIRENNGSATHLICGFDMLEVLDDLFPAEDRLPASTVGGDAPLQTIRTTHGNLKIVPDYMAPSGTIYLTNPKYFGFLPYREFFYTKYTEQGDNTVTDVIGEYTFFLRHGNYSHAKIAGISV